MRKEADLHIADRIRLVVEGGEDILAAHAAYIQSETLCVELAAKLEKPSIERTFDIEGQAMKVGLVRGEQ
jgi:activator of 2-hydroxyglutaryl-CoA dehydratase